MINHNLMLAFMDNQFYVFHTILIIIKIIQIILSLDKMIHFYQNHFILSKGVFNQI